MEKRTPHTSLGTVKSLIESGRVRLTNSALVGGAALGFNAMGIIDVVNSLKLQDFYKSMTTYADHRVWQDVYRKRTSAGDVYLKLTVDTDVVIISFKEL
jgi:motility quorum-sensing regulator/GCU-specific mRNA interferase toxin